MLVTGHFVLVMDIGAFAQWVGGNAWGTEMYAALQSLVNFLRPVPMGAPELSEL